MFSNCTASPSFAMQKPTRIPELVSCMPALEAYTVAPATVRFFTAGLGTLVPCCSLLEMRPNSPAALPLSRSSTYMPVMVWPPPSKIPPKAFTVVLPLCCQI